VTLDLLELQVILVHKVKVVTPVNKAPRDYWVSLDNPDNRESLDGQELQGRQEFRDLKASRVRKAQVVPEVTLALLVKQEILGHKEFRDSLVILVPLDLQDRLDQLDSLEILDREAFKGKME